MLKHVLLAAALTCVSGLALADEVPDRTGKNDRAGVAASSGSNGGGRAVYPAGDPRNGPNKPPAFDPPLPWPSSPPKGH